MRTYNITAQHQREISEHRQLLGSTLQEKLGVLTEGPMHLTLTDDEAKQIAGVLSDDHPLQAALAPQIEQGIDDSEKVVVYHSLHELKLGPRIYTQEQIDFLNNLPVRELSATPLPIDE